METKHGLQLLVMVEKKEVVEMSTDIALDAHVHLPRAAVRFIRREMSCARMLFKVACRRRRSAMRR
jgi:hypothetical protein